MFLRHILIAFILFSATPALAQQDLGAVETKLEQSRTEQLKRDAEARALREELDKTRKESTTLAAAIRKNEKDLIDLEDRITAMTGEQQQITVRLEADYGSIGNLVLALQRLRRTPPEALIIRPGAPLQTAQTAMLLESILPAVSKRANELSASLERLAAIRLQLDADRETVLATRADLDTKRAELEKLLKDREKLYSSAESGRKEAAREVKRLAAEAESLRDLLSKLEAQKQKTQGNRTASSKPVNLPGLGKAQIPAEGIVTVAYGETDDIGARSEGMTIESRASSLVVAPMGGAVVFVGPFRDYGNMVIIEHKKDYHSLIAGLGKTNVSEGDAVNSGEPIGSLPSSSSRGGKPALYYELRQKGRPVDPSSAFPGLKS
jgi:septal ring factor EnvC (AmiA/AmiB activator)